MDMLKLFVHTLFFMFSTLALVRCSLLWQEENIGATKKWYHFSLWNILFQSVYFGLNILTDLIESKSNPPHKSQRSSIQVVRDLIHSCIAFPSAMTVTILFWSENALDKNQIWPESYIHVMPNGLNHLLHTTVLIFIVLDKLVVRHHYPSKSAGVALTSLFAIVHVIWVYNVHATSKSWVYSILEGLSDEWRVAYLGLALLLLLLSQLCGDLLTLYLWGAAPSLTALEKAKTR